jgi:hypothetical protein
MEAADLIEQDERNFLILGLEGEWIFNNFEFLLGIHHTKGIQCCP